MLIPQDFILSPFFISGYSLNRIPAQARCNSVHNPHVLNGFISELLYMETVRNTTGGRKADTGYLFHIRSHIKCYFPYLKVLASGKFQKDGYNSLYVSAFYDGDNTPSSSSFLLVYQYGI